MKKLSQLRRSLSKKSGQGSFKEESAVGLDASKNDATSFTPPPPSATTSTASSSAPSSPSKQQHVVVKGAGRPLTTDASPLPSPILASHDQDKTLASATTSMVGEDDSKLFYDAQQSNLGTTNLSAVGNNTTTTANNKTSATMYYSALSGRTLADDQASVIISKVDDYSTIIADMQHLDEQASGIASVAEETIIEDGSGVSFLAVQEEKSQEPPLVKDVTKKSSGQPEEFIVLNKKSLEELKTDKTETAVKKQPKDAPSPCAEFVCCM